MGDWGGSEGLLLGSRGVRRLVRGVYLRLVVRSAILALQVIGRYRLLRVRVWVPEILRVFVRAVLRADFRHRSIAGTHRCSVLFAFEGGMSVRSAVLGVSNVSPRCGLPTYSRLLPWSREPSIRMRQSVREAFRRIRRFLTEVVSLIDNIVCADLWRGIVGVVPCARTLTYKLPGRSGWS